MELEDVSESESEEEGDAGLTADNVERVLDAREDPQAGEQFYVKFKRALRAAPRRQH